MKKRVGLSLIACSLGSLLEAGNTLEGTPSRWEFHPIAAKTLPESSERWVSTNPNRSWPKPRRRRAYTLHNVKASRRRRTV